MTEWISPPCDHAGRMSIDSVQLRASGETIFATWFTFGQDGKPLWLVIGVLLSAGTPAARRIIPRGRVRPARAALHLPPRR